MKQQPLKRAHFYWLDTLLFLFKVPPTGRNAQVQTALKISDGPLQLGYRNLDVSDQLLDFVEALRFYS